METTNNRRSFIQKSITGIATVLGSDVVFAKNLPKKVEILGEKAFIDLPEGKNKELCFVFRATIFVPFANRTTGPAGA